MGLSAGNRLTAKGDFDRVMADGRRVTRPEFVLYHRSREAPDVPRIGFAVGRRIGGAVVRNRTRRVLREVVRALVPRLVPCDIVVVARPSIVGSGAGDIATALTEATARAGLLRDHI